MILVNLYINTTWSAGSQQSPILTPSLKCVYIHGKNANWTFCPKHKTRMSIFYQLNMFQIHGILRNIQLGISLRVRNQWVLMNIITIMTIMCPYFKRHTSMLKYWVYTLSRPMFPSTQSLGLFRNLFPDLPHEATISNYEGEKKRKDREVTTLGNLVRRD